MRVEGYNTRRWQTTLDRPGIFRFLLPVLRDVLVARPFRRLLPVGREVRFRLAHRWLHDVVVVLLYLYPLFLLGTPAQS